MLQPSTSHRPLSVIYQAAGTLKPDARNPRTHPKRHVDQIVASMREFGFTNPILVDPDGVIIAGHGRLLAAKAMGLTEVPTIEVKFAEFPSPLNPLGVKGVGESGCVPAAGAIISAVENALAPFGVRIEEYPVTPARLFALLTRAQKHR